MDYAYELQEDVESLREEGRQLRIELSIATDKAKELTIKSQSQVAEIKDLKYHNQDLEAKLQDIRVKTRREVEQELSRLSKLASDQELDLTALKDLVKLKNKELRNLRVLAQAVLDQRAEIEEFLLASLEQVKQEAAREDSEAQVRQII